MVGNASIVWNAERKTNMYLDLPCLWIFNILTVFIKGQKISLGKFMGMALYKCTWKLIMGYLHLHGTCWPSFLTIIARGYSTFCQYLLLYYDLLIYRFKDMSKVWTRFPLSQRNRPCSQKMWDTVCATTLYSWANWQLFASIPSLFFNLFYWSMFMYCIWIIL